MFFPNFPGATLIPESRVSKENGQDSEIGSFFGRSFDIINCFRYLLIFSCNPLLKEKHIPWGRLRTKLLFLKLISNNQSNQNQNSIRISNFCQKLNLVLVYVQYSTYRSCLIKMAQNR